MLVMLDNAGSADQVRPLLPGTPACTVVVTSRDALAGLVARDGATRLDLDLLPLEDAVALLRTLIGARVDAAPDAAAELADQCCRLPLALRVAAELATSHPGVPLAQLTGELADLHKRLDLLAAGGDRRTAVRAVFSWSYQHLGADAARAFRLLGLHPGPDFEPCAAAAVTGMTAEQARQMLGELTRAHLIAEHLPGRYAFHDLLRAYAAEQAHHTGSDTGRREATGRVLDHYLHTAARAAPLLDPAMEPVVLAPPRPGAAPGQPADHSQALAWFEAEHQVLLAAVTLAAGSGFDSHAWQLPWAMTNFLQTRGHYQEWATTQRTALAAATRLGDTAAQALSGRLLAGACTHLGDHDQARGHFASSLTLYQRLGNRLGEAKIHQGLGALADGQGRYADALSHSEQALRVYQDIGDKAGEAAALNNVGWCHSVLGDYQQARAFCRQALTLGAETGDRVLEGRAWDSLGYAEHHLGNFAEAAACYQGALSLKRESGDRFSEAATLTHLGDTRHAAGELAQAREARQQALAILEDLQHPDADQVRAKLASTNDHASRNPST
jgi:tetratricopeptide (TPR) repeat protein